MNGQYFNTLSNLVCGRDVSYPINLGWPHQFKMFCQWYRLPDGEIILSSMPLPPKRQRLIIPGKFFAGDYPGEVL